MNKIFIYARPCVNKMTSAIFSHGCRVSVLLSCSAVFLRLKTWKKPVTSCPIFLSALTFYVLIQLAARIKPNSKKTRKLRVSQIVGRPAAANFGRETITGSRKDPNWSLTTIKGKISVFIVVLKFVMHFCNRRTIRLNRENFSCNNKTNYTRRHKFITHKNNCCQVFSFSRNDQPLFVN